MENLDITLPLEEAWSLVENIWIPRYSLRELNYVRSWIDSLVKDGLAR